MDAIGDAAKEEVAQLEMAPNVIRLATARAAVIAAEDIALLAIRDRLEKLTVVDDTTVVRPGVVVRTVE